jgi:hypothetical protein
MTMIQPSTLEASRTGRFTRLLCGGAFYVVFFFTFLYAIGFVEGLLVPEAIDTGTAVPRGEALLVDFLVTTAYILVGIFLEERSNSSG